MLKKTLLTALLFASTITTAHISIDFTATVENDLGIQSVSGNISTENNIAKAFTYDDFMIEILPQEENDTITLFTKIYTKVNDTFELLSQPVIAAEWNTPAVITLGNDANSYTLCVVVTECSAE